MLRKIFLTATGIIIFVSYVFAESGTFKASVFPAPPNLSAEVSFSEPSGNKMLDAEEIGKLIITVKNSGKGDAFDVNADIKADKKIKGLFYDSAMNLGTVESGQTIKKEIEIKATEDVSTLDIKFNIKVKEANGFDADTIAISFKTKAFEPPKLIVADIGMDDANENSKVEPLENVELTARIQNIGHGDARNVEAEVIHGSNVFIGGDGVTHFNLGSIQAGKYKDIKFIFYTNKQIKNGEKIPIEIKINEARPQFKSVKALDIVMNAPQRKTTEIFVQGEEQPKGEIEIASGLSIDVDMKIPEGKKAGIYDIAVIIGNKNYSAAGIPDVVFADRDARIMKEYIIKTFGYKPENIIYAEDATVGKFNEIFGSRRTHGRLFKYIKEDVSEVFIYYVGHGAPDLESKEAYFVPVDANPQYISVNGYKLKTFYENLSKLPAKKITIIIDACFSGNSDSGMLFKNISPGIIKVKKEYKGPNNAVLITSAAIDQVSAWYPEKKHSLFTYYFLKGLQGEADTNNDKVITIGEIRDYLKGNVPYMARRLSGVEQNPVFDGNEKEILVKINK